MSVSHGDLFSEIGELVLAANSGAPIDLSAKSEELAERYKTLGLSEDVLARAISRSIGAIGLSMAKLASADRRANGSHGATHLAAQGEGAADEKVVAQSGKGAAALFPSGVRLAVLS